MIKSRFSNLVRSRNKTAQLNEVLLNVLCHNIYVLIQELGATGTDLTKYVHKVESFVH